MVNRRTFFKKILWLSGSFLSAALGLKYWWSRKQKNSQAGESLTMSDVKMFNIDFQWPTFEPFLFCVHHYDKYPEGNGAYGPDVKFLSGRNMGQDFEEKDGFRMYHGEEVPGFPVHPHRGFETITIVRKGYVDHADSLGAAGRYGEGDVQWMTAGAGVQHSEMFPLLRTDNKNTVELFQIWLNLPRRSKMVPAHFKMFWSEKIPKVKAADGSHEVTVIAGEYAGAKALPPPPDSWASDKDGEVMILLVKLQKGATINLPKSNSEANRTLYFFEGNSFSINNQEIQNKIGLHLSAQQDLSITANHEEGQFLVLQAKPIGEPVFQHGPFVMNTREDIINTIQDYQKTQFGGWPWKRHDMVHGDKIERFALYPDGKRETPS